MQACCGLFMVSNERRYTIYFGKINYSVKIHLLFLDLLLDQESGPTIDVAAILGALFKNPIWVTY